jgi:GT2 family glycosyltransferase
MTIVSIIVPTYNDWARLSTCLQALSKQSYPDKLFEIIVVNNNPASGPPDDLVLPVNCKIINEEKAGSYAARNAAINIAQGEIIGFTDSDCIPDKDWINNAVNYMYSNPTAGRIAGCINLFYRAPKLKPVELYEKVYAFDQEFYVTNDATAVTANLFTYRSVFATVGLFNDKLMSGGDYEWSKRAQNAGIEIQYAKSVSVNHPARYFINELVYKAKRVGGGQAMFSKLQDENIFNRLLRLIYDLRPPVRSIPVINKRGDDLDFMQKTSVFFMRYYLSVITAYEKFLVGSGKKPYHL